MVTTVLVEKRTAAKPAGGSQTLPDVKTPQGSQVTAEDLHDTSDRYRQICIRAYLKAEQRGFAPGHMWDDWLAAEREINEELATGSAPRSSAAGSDSAT